MLRDGQAVLVLPGQPYCFRIGAGSYGMSIDFDCAWRLRERYEHGTRWLPVGDSVSLPISLAMLWGTRIPNIITGRLGESAHLLLAEVGDLWWRSPGEHMLANARMSAFLAQLFQEVVECLTGRDTDRWSEVRTWAERRLEHGVRVEDMAAHAGLDRSTFTRRWQLDCGTSPGAFLHDLRLHRAAALLREGRLGLGQIALHCGWRSRCAFDVAFSKRYGTTPGIWRDRMRRSWASKSTHGDVDKRVVERQFRPKG